MDAESSKPGPRGGAMKALSQLGIAAHIATAILIVAVLGGRAAYVTVYPGPNVSVQQHADFTYHPYASVAGAMLPSVVGGLIVFAGLRWLAKKNGPNISNRDTTKISAPILS